MRKLLLSILLCFCSIHLNAGVDVDVSAEDKATIESAKKEAIAGFPLAQLLLGLSYLQGAYGMEVNSEKGIYWITKAACQNHMDSIEALVDYYRDQKDLVKCVEWANAGVLLGSTPSMRALAYCYGQRECPEIVTDYAESFKWYLLAASGGNKNAIMFLDAIKHETNIFKTKEYANGLRRAQTWLKLNDQVKITISPEYLNPT